MTADEIDALAAAIVRHLDLPTKAEILEALRSGVDDAMPLGSDITDTVRDAVACSMPEYNEVLQAIYSAHLAKKGR